MKIKFCSLFCLFLSWNSSSFAASLLFENLCVPVRRLTSTGVRCFSSHGDDRGRFAKATFDTSFKHMLQDSEVQLSFLRTFTDREDIVQVTPYPSSLPTLRNKEKSQRHMDFACRIRNGDIFIAEVQVRREDYWDPRALYYAAGVYSQQLGEGEPYSMLQNVIGINILDHDTGTLTKLGDFEKHYVMTDRLHPDQSWPYIQIRQFELPRIKFDVLPEGPKKQWLRVFKESVKMDDVPKDFDPIIQKALSYLDRKKWGGELVSAYASEELDLSKYTAVLKEERIEGQKEGVAKIALKMLKRNRPIDEIAEDTGLSIAEIQKLKDHG